MKNININVHHITRTEGHGNIIANVSNGKIEKCEWQVPEAPRFFEAMIRGRHYSEVGRVVSRICGICAVGHTLASVKATEAALGINVTEQTVQLRKILKHAENFDSNVLHIYFLAAPDLFGVKSVLPLVKTHTKVVQRALRLKRLSHEWGSLIGGRTTHPTTVLPGGFTRFPTITELKELKTKLQKAVPDLNETLKTVASVASKIPVFERPTEYIALSSEKDYSLYDGTVQSTLYSGEKEKYDLKDYKKITNEYVVAASTAKHCKNKLDSYAAGALARFNNNSDKLHPEAKKAAKKLGLKPICTNPFMNTVAQLVELFHNVFQTIELVDSLIKKGIKEEDLVKPVKYSSGVGSVEVPRGILFHEYEYNKDGICVGGNCIIPTNQNHGNIQKDFEALLPALLKQNKSEKEIELTMEMLVRAYDPCISCSTHYLDIKFIR